MTHSKRKGKDGELEFAKVLRGWGFQARRGQQFRGGPGSPDVVGVFGVHFEVKRCEKLSLYEAMDQAVSEAGPGEIPILAHRRSRRPWLLIVRACEFPLLRSVWSWDELRRREDP